MNTFWNTTQDKSIYGPSVRFTPANWELSPQEPSVHDPCFFRGSESVLFSERMATPSLALGFRTLPQRIEVFEGI